MRGTRLRAGWVAARRDRLGAGGVFVFDHGFHSFQRARGDDSKSRDIGRRVLWPFPKPLPPLWHEPQNPQSTPTSRHFNTFVHFCHLGARKARSPRRVGKYYARLATQSMHSATRGVVNSNVSNYGGREATSHFFGVAPAPSAAKPASQAAASKNSAPGSRKAAK